MAKLKTDSANQLRMIEASSMRDVAVAALSNPIVTLVGGVIIVSAAEKANIVSDDWANILKGGVIGVATMQALAPVVKESGLTGALLGLIAGGTAGALAEGAGGLATGAVTPLGKSLLVGQVPGLKTFLTKILSWVNPFD
jgi:hypothetical protein